MIIQPPAIILHCTTIIAEVCLNLSNETIKPGSKCIAWNKHCSKKKKNHEYPDEWQNYLNLIFIIKVSEKFPQVKVLDYTTSSQSLVQLAIDIETSIL